MQNDIDFQPKRSVAMSSRTIPEEGNNNKNGKCEKIFLPIYFGKKKPPLSVFYYLKKNAGNYGKFY